MHNTDKNFWKGDPNLMQIAFFLGRCSCLFETRGWFEEAKLCNVNVASYFNNAIDKINEG